jgi:hypothetical protein
MIGRADKGANVSEQRAVVCCSKISILTPNRVAWPSRQCVAGYYMRAASNGLDGKSVYNMKRGNPYSSQVYISYFHQTGFVIYMLYIREDSQRFSSYIHFPLKYFLLFYIYKLRKPKNLILYNLYYNKNYRNVYMQRGGGPEGKSHKRVT